MKTKINSLTIVNQQGTSQYFVGQEYNGLVLHEIIDKSAEFPDSLTIIYVGKTKEGEFVFEAINAPIEVRYSAS